MRSPISRRSFLQITGTAGAAGLLAACGGSSSSTGVSAVSLSEGDVALTLSWWGDDSRHAAYQEALAAFCQAHPSITVTPSFTDRASWEDALSASLASGMAGDVCQITWNWLYTYAGGQAFLDLQTVSDYLDLSQWEENALSTCRMAGVQQAVPISLMGRIFYWNMTTFRRAGITEVPRTLEDLYAAGEAFQTQLGDDYYPLYTDGYGRMTLAVFYLESLYGKPWADPAAHTLNYSLQEIIEGLDFVKDLVDKHVLMSLPTYYGSNGTTPIVQTTQWSTGQLAGVFAWDTSASQYQAALDDDNRSGFTVGEEIQFGDYKGGFLQVCMALAIPQSCQHPAEAAALIQFLLNEETGAAILGSACGIPASRSGLASAQAAGTLDPLMEEAHRKVVESCLFQADPLFEDDTLASDSGIYQQIFEVIDYDGTSGSAVANDLIEGMAAAGYITSF